MAYEQEIRTTYSMKMKVESAQAKKMLEGLDASLARMTKDMENAISGMSSSLTRSLKKIRKEAKNNSVEVVRAREEEKRITAEVYREHKEGLADLKQANKEYNDASRRALEIEKRLTAEARKNAQMAVDNNRAALQANKATIASKQQLLKSEQDILDMKQRSEALDAIKDINPLKTSKVLETELGVLHKQIKATETLIKDDNIQIAKAKELLRLSKAEVILAEKDKTTSAGKKRLQLAQIKLSKDQLHYDQLITKEMQEQVRAAKLKEQVAKKNVNLNQAKQADKDGSFLGTIKHAAVVAPIYMGVAQAANLAQTAIGSVILASVEFDNTMRVLSAVTGENLEVTKQLTEGVMQLGNAYGGALADYAETAKELSRAGIDTSELIKATEVTAQLGLITGDSIQSASNAIISYSQVYQKAGNKMVYTTEQLGDKLAYMANASRLSTEDIGTLSNYALASSKSVGITIDTVNALAVAFSNAGNNASTIGTQIRRFTSTLTSNSTAVKEFYAFTGTSRQDLVADMLKSKSGTPEGIEASNEAFENFVRNVQSLSESEYRDAIQGMNILDNQFFNQLRNNGDEIVGHLKKSFSDLAGELDKTAVIADGMGKRWEAMGNRIINTNEGWVSSLGELSTHITEGFMHAGAQTVNYLDGWTTLDDEVDKTIDNIIESTSRIRDTQYLVDSSEAGTKLNEYATIANSVNQKLLASQQAIEHAQKRGIEVTGEQIFETRKLTEQSETYLRIIELAKKSNSENTQKIAEERIALEERLSVLKATSDAEQQRTAQIQLQEAVRKKNEAKSFIKDNQLDPTAVTTGLAQKQAKAELLIQQEIVEEQNKLIRSLAVKAKLTDEELRKLQLNKAERKAINSETALLKALNKDEIRTLETLARALKNTTDQRQLAVGIQAIQDGIDRNTLANAKFMNATIAEEVRWKEVGIELDLNKVNLGSEHLQKLIEERNWTEAIATLQTAQQLIALEKVKLDAESVIYNKEQVRITEELLLATSAERIELTKALEINKSKRDEIEQQRAALSGMAIQLTNQGSILGRNLQVSNSLTSAFNNQSTAIKNQLGPLRSVTDELMRQHKIAMSNAGLEKSTLNSKNKDEALALFGSSVNNLYKGKSGQQLAELHKEALKEVKRISDHYDDIDVQTKVALNKKKIALEKELQKEVARIGKSGYQVKIQDYKTELKHRKDLLKASIKDEKELKEQLALADKAYNDKVKKATAKGVTKASKSAESKESKEKRDYEAEAKAAYAIRQQLIQIQALEDESKLGYVDKLKVLKNELSLLHSIDGQQQLIKNKNDHTLDILKKEAEIRKEMKTLRDKEFVAWDKETKVRLNTMTAEYEARHALKYGIADATGITISLDEQITDKVSKIVDELNKASIVSGEGLLDTKTIAKIKAKVKKDISPTLMDGISNAFNINKNTKLAESLDKIGYRIGNSLDDVVDGIFTNLQSGKGLSESVTGSLNDVAGSMYESMRQSDDPIEKAIGYGVAIIESFGSTFEPLVVNEHIDNKAIISSMETLNDTMFPHLELTRKMSEHLENMDKAFGSMASNILFGRGDISGKNYEGFAGGFGDNFNNLTGNDFVDGLLSGMGNFISGKSVSLQNAGLHFAEQTADSIAEGVDADAYQNIRTRRRTLGIKTSDSSSIHYSSIDMQLQRDLDSIFTEGNESILESAESLRILSAESRLASTQLEEVFLDFNGMDEAAIKSSLQGEIGQRLDTMAESALGGSLDTFRHTGEGYYELLMRTSVGYDQASEALKRLNIEAVNIGDIENRQGDVATETIRDSILNEQGRAWETKYREVAEASIANVGTSLGNLFGTVQASLNGTDFSATSLNTYMQSYQEVTDAQLTGLGELVKGYRGSADGLIEFYTTLDDFQFQLRDINVSTSEVTQNMIDGAGSVNALTKGQDSYISNFFTEQEQSEIKMRALNKEFEQFNITMPESTDAFRAYIQSIDLSTEAGQKLYGELIPLSADFYSVFEAEAASTKKRIEEIDNFIKDSALNNLSYFNMFEKTELAKKRLVEELTTDNAKDYLTNLKGTAGSYQDYKLEYDRTMYSLKNSTKVKEVMTVSNPETDKKLEALTQKVDSLNNDNKEDNKELIAELKETVAGLKDLLLETSKGNNNIVSAVSKASLQAPLKRVGE